LLIHKRHIAGSFRPRRPIEPMAGYSAGTQGFSLGFDRELLAKRIALDNAKAKATLEQCVYEDAEKAAFFEEIGRFSAARFEELRRRNRPAPTGFVTFDPEATNEYKKAQYYFLDALSKATARVFTTAARIKNIGFREEREWRVIFQVAKDALAPIEKGGRRVEILKFRDGQFGRTPYIEIPLLIAERATSPLHRIVVGPGASRDDKKRYVELLLLNRGIEVVRLGGGVEIATSVIPYRAT